MSRIIKTILSSEDRHNYRMKYSVGVDHYYCQVQRTWNCQMQYFHGIDDLISVEIRRSDCEKLFKEVLIEVKRRCNKPLLLIDCSMKTKDFLEANYSPIIHTVSPYLSTNDNNRNIILLNISNLDLVP